MAKELFELVGRILIDNKEANEDIDETTGKAKGLGDALNGTGESAEKTGKQLGPSGKFGSGSVWFGNMLTRMTDLGIRAGKFIGKTGIAFNANMEGYQNQFASLLGDADKAAKLVSDLQELAKISPLGMEGLAKNAITLLTTGFELTEIIPTLQSLGDVSLGDQNKMDSVVRAYTQIVNKGQMLSEEMNQLSDAGVPIIELMTKYGGEKYADGEWYMKKLTDKKYTIPAEDVVKAFAAATAEGGKWHDYMLNMMDTWSGQMDRMGEEGKESLGALTKPFFEEAKSNVLPKMAESLAMFGTWATENQDTLTKVAEAMGNFATVSFDAVLTAFQWMTENGEAVAVAIGAIGTAMGIAAATAHPYATAVAAIASALVYLNSETGKKRGNFDHMFDGYTDEQLQTLNAYVDALNAMKEAEEAALADVSGNSWGNYDEKYAAYEAALQELLAIEDLYETYNTWHSAQDGYAGGNGPALKVQLRADENAEADMQAEIDKMAMDAVVDLNGDTAALQSDLNRANLTAPVNLYGVGGTDVDGSHASGLDYVPRNGYIAKLHEGEAVLNKADASTWRGGGAGNIEAKLDKLIAIMAGGFPVTLDSGAVVGQLAPAMDARLGTISNRKGRRN